MLKWICEQTILSKHIGQMEDIHKIFFKFVLQNVMRLQNEKNSICNLVFTAE